MSAAEKGERYARIFRKAGVFIGKGNIPRAVETLKEGVGIATEQGDLSMVKRFDSEISRITTRA
jgi:hypothetical protein